MVSPRILLPILGSWLIHLTLGTLYTWANIGPYVTAYLRWHGAEDLDYADMSWASALAGSFMGLFMFLGGQLQLKIGVRAAALVGSWLFSLAVGLSSVTVTMGRLPFLLSYGVCFGMGLGLAYTAPLVCLMQWLPQRRGLASGIVVFAFGSGAALFNFMQSALINPASLNPDRHIGSEVYYNWTNSTVESEVLVNVPPVFARLAVTYVVMQSIGAALLVSPGPGEAGESRPESLVAPLRDSFFFEAQFDFREMIRVREFWLVCFAFFCNCQGLFWATSFSKTMGESLSIPDHQITMTLAASALCNGLGRVVWGNLADRTSFRTSLLALCAVQPVLLSTLPLCTGAAWYLIWICGIFFCVGGNFALFPKGTADYFGSLHFGTNYGIVFLGNSLSMILGPIIGQAVRAHSEEDDLQGVRCWTAACFVLMGGLATALMDSPKAMNRRLDDG